jgi:hypothetical protein
MSDIVTEALVKYGELAILQSQVYQRQKELEEIISNMTPDQFYEYDLVVTLR